MQTGHILESHLTGMDAIVGYVLTHGDIKAPTESIRGRLARPKLFFTVQDRDTAVTEHDRFDWVFAKPMIAALRFDSQHGSVVVADLWCDCNYKQSTGVKGQQLLRSPTLPRSQLPKLPSTSPIANRVLKCSLT